MDKELKPITFIESIRKSDRYIETIYMQGGCYQFYLVLKLLFPHAKPFITPKKDHIVTEIDGVYYDIRGVYQESIVFDIKPEDILEIEKWSFSRTMMLSVGECQHCEEPILIPV